MNVAQSGGAKAAKADEAPPTLHVARRRVEEESEYGPGFGLTSRSSTSCFCQKCRPRWVLRRRLALDLACLPGESRALRRAERPQAANGELVLAAQGTPKPHPRCRTQKGVTVRGAASARRHCLTEAGSVPQTHATFASPLNVAGKTAGTDGQTDRQKTDRQVVHIYIYTFYVHTYIHTYNPA